MKTLIIFLASLFVLPASAEQKSLISLQFLAFPRSADDTPVELKVGKETFAVELPANRLSDPIKVPSSKRWTFGQTTATDEGPSQFKVLGSGKALSSDTQIVLLLRKGPLNSNGFRVLSYNSSGKGFGDRQFLFLNMSNQAIAAEVGGVKFALRPARHVVISPKADMGKNLCHAELLLQRKGKWRPFISNKWPLKPDTRGLILIYDDPKTSKIRLHTIRDFL